MKKIPIKHAIESGSWFRVTTKDNVEFRIKINSFSKIKIKSVDSAKNIDKKYDFTQGNFWLLSMDFTSLSKEELREGCFFSEIVVIDQDDFEFNISEDKHLSRDSHFAESSGLKLFYYNSYIPKVKYTGALPFFLPNEENAEYHIGIRRGEIQEI